MARTLFIVSRRHPDLYEYLKERFANDDQVQVILDRRAGPPGRRADAERGAEERRTRPEVDTELESRSHAVVTVA